jgi:ABC-type bacteriocin/lantibiotic exporter with double-glycine peptidase domain
MLLAGLLEPGSGKVFIGDRDLADLDPADFRSRIGYVDQNSGLMSGSILENIRLGNEEASIDQVCEATAAAGIDGFISGLPMKYETILGAGGTGISGGQRQRIALARVLVKRPQILILDEATSAVDPDTEREIFERIKGLGVTLVVLGHRAAVAADADAILTIERGRGTFTRRSSRDAAS